LFQSAKQTTEGLASLAEYLILQKQQSYVLLGKIQSDRLEGRFGKLRQLNGGNLFASVRQILEAERSLKIKNLALLDLSLSEIRDIFQDSENEHQARVESAAKQLLEGVELGHSIEVPNQLKNSIENILFFVGGYISKTINQQQNCESCKSLLVSAHKGPVSVVCEPDSALTAEENDRRLTFIQQANRGGLTFPSDFMFSVCVLAWELLEKINNDPALSHILFQPNISCQKVFCLTFLRYLDSCQRTRDNFTEFECENGHLQRDNLKSIAKKIFNVFSKNYVSSKNSLIHSKKSSIDTNDKRVADAMKLQKLRSGSH